MSKPVPKGLDEPMRQFLQDATESLGYPNSFRFVKVSDTEFRIQMKVGNVWKSSSIFTVS